MLPKSFEVDFPSSPSSFTFWTGGRGKWANETSQSHPERSVLVIVFYPCLWQSIHFYSFSSYYICTAIFAVCLARRAHFPSKKSNKAFKFYEKFAHFFSTLFFFVNFAVFFPNCIWIHFMGREQKMQIIERKEWWGKKHWIAFCTHKSMRKLRERREEMLITFKVRTISIANGWKYLRLTPQKLWNKNSVEKSIRHNQSVIKVFLFSGVLIGIFFKPLKSLQFKCRKMKLSKNEKTM